MVAVDCMERRSFLARSCWWRNAAVYLVFFSYIGCNDLRPPSLKAVIDSWPGSLAYYSVQNTMDNLIYGRFSYNASKVILPIVRLTLCPPLKKFNFAHNIQVGLSLCFCVETYVEERRITRERPPPTASAPIMHCRCRAIDDTPRNFVWYHVLFVCLGRNTNSCIFCRECFVARGGLGGGRGGWGGASITKSETYSPEIPIT